MTPNLTAEQIREAVRAVRLYSMPGTPLHALMHDEVEYWDELPRSLVALAATALNYADLLQAQAEGRVVIIRKGEDGKWPQWLLDRLGYAMSGPLVPDDSGGGRAAKAAVGCLILPFPSVAERAAKAALDCLIVPLPEEEDALAGGERLRRHPDFIAGMERIRRSGETLTGG